MSLSPDALLASFAKPPTPTEIFEQALYQRATHLNLNSRELRRAFLALPERLWGLPTGVYNWKLWRGHNRLGGFVPHDEGHSRVADCFVFLLPDGARAVKGETMWELHHRGRVLHYSFTPTFHLVQADAWGIESGTL